MTIVTATIGAKGRQRVLNELCRRVLAHFEGRRLTPTLIAEAEATLRTELDLAVKVGNYPIPDGLELDRVELGLDMRIKVLFKKIGAVPAAVARIPLMPSIIESPRHLTRHEAVAAELDNEEEP